MTVKYILGGQCPPMESRGYQPWRVVYVHVEDEAGHVSTQGFHLPEDQARQLVGIMGPPNVLCSTVYLNLQGDRIARPGVLAMLQLVLKLSAVKVPWYKPAAKVKRVNLTYDMEKGSTCLSITDRGGKDMPLSDFMALIRRFL